MNSGSFEEWVGDACGVVALHLRQKLVSVEGEDAVIFPPTYAGNPPYVIDTLADGIKVALIDSVGSQANRMEPIFGKKDKDHEKYRELVPQITIEVELKDGKGEKRKKEIPIFEVGHRVADALVRSSKPGDAELALGEEAFRALAKGNALPMAKLAPTSLVFGVWDSRGTQVKKPRLINSVIRAHDVSPLHRSAQYKAALRPDEYAEVAGFKEDELRKAEGHTKSPLAKAGFVDVPSTGDPGGIIANGGVYRDCTVNLVALRQLQAESEEETEPLRRYILGLTLVAATYPQDGFLRQGCLLVEDEGEKKQWQAVHRNGQRDDLALTHDDALAFAQEAAGAFGVGSSLTAAFDAKLARDVLAAARKQKD